MLTPLRHSVCGDKALGESRPPRIIFRSSLTPRTRGWSWGVGTGIQDLETVAVAPREVFTQDRPDSPAAPYRRTPDFCHDHRNTKTSFGHGMPHVGQQLNRQTIISLSLYRNSRGRTILIVVNSCAHFFGRRMLQESSKIILNCLGRGCQN